VVAGFINDNETFQGFTLLSQASYPLTATRLRPKQRSGAPPKMPSKLPMIDLVLSANDPYGNGQPLYTAVPQLRLLPPDITFPPLLPVSAAEWYLPIAAPEVSFDLKPAAAPVAFVLAPQPAQQPEQPLSPVPALTALVERVARALERLVG
jgi:hypothetical protein